MAMRPFNTDPTGQLALDANALASLRQQARTAPAQAVGKAAGQFEALFVQMVLKQMRDALPQDGPLTSDTTKSYTAMFDQQLAQQLSGHGIGLRKLIEQQLARHMGSSTGTTDEIGVDPKGEPSKALKSLPEAAAAEHSSAAGRVGAKALAIAKAAAKAATMTAAGPAQPSAIVGGVQGFLDKLRPHAEAVAQAVGVPAHYLLAQAGLETGWGKSLARAPGGETSHNLFGIKAGANWTGPVVEAATTEYVNGKAVRVVERFRSYASFTEAFQDFANLLRGNARYAGALAQAGNAHAYAQGLQKAGYATDPQYGAKLARSIDYVGRRLAASPVQVPGAPVDNKTAAM